MRAFTDLMKPPSPVSLAELRAREAGWRAKLDELRAEQVEMSALAEDGDEAALAKLSTIAADISATEDRLARVTAALTVAERRQAQADEAATEEARAVRAAGLDAEIQAITDGGDRALADFHDAVSRLKAAVPAVQVLANKAGLSMAVAENMLVRLRSDVSFALRGLLEVTAPDVKPPSPFARFGQDIRADLGRIGLALPLAEDASDA